MSQLGPDQDLMRQLQSEMQRQMSAKIDRLTQMVGDMESERDEQTKMLLEILDYVKRKPGAARAG